MPAEKIIRAVDAFQQRHSLIGFPFAVVKKYGDDDGGRLAGLIAYYGFFSVFPLLLVFTSVLGFVLSGNDDLRQRILDSALGQFPVLGDAIATEADIDGLEGSWVSIVVGGVTALWAGLGVAQAAQAAMNTVWDIPRADWPNFVYRRLRALAMLAILGTIVIASTFVSGVQTSGWASSTLSALAAWALVLVLNFALFVLTYQVLTARNLKWVNVVPGAAFSAVGWSLLQAVGSYYVTRQLEGASDVYGTFALVLVLLVWISLGAQLTLLGAEINVVRNRRLWPRSLTQPPLTEGDRRVYSSVVHRSRLRPEVTVDVSFVQSEHPANKTASSA